MAETQFDGVHQASEEAQSTVEELEQRSNEVGEDIEHAKKRWDDAQTSEDVPTAAGDWEDSEPDAPVGDDPAGFDDPETADADEDEDEDDDLDDE